MEGLERKRFWEGEREIGEGIIEGKGREEGGTGVREGGTI